MAVEHPSLMGGDEVEEAELATKRLRDANAAAAKQTKAAESAAKKGCQTSRLMYSALFMIWLRVITVSAAEYIWQGPTRRPDCLLKL